jgi:hypothetical protein
MRAIIQEVSRNMAQKFFFKEYTQVKEKRLQYKNKFDFFIFASSICSSTLTKRFVCLLHAEMGPNVNKLAFKDNNLEDFALALCFVSQC